MLEIKDFGALSDSNLNDGALVAILVHGLVQAVHSSGTEAEDAYHDHDDQEKDHQVII
jgi:hypothetical protein